MEKLLLIISGTLIGGALGVGACLVIFDEMWKSCPDPTSGGAFCAAFGLSAPASAAIGGIAGALVFLRAANKG